MALGLPQGLESGPQERATSLRCSACRRQWPAGTRFCCECGTTLSPRCARKQVSVLVADISGFTAMSERLDPEDVRELLEAAFDVMLNAVHGHHGRVNQFLGDGMMALFEGAGVVAGDEHRRRALRAALAIQHDLAPIREEASHRHGIDFRIRIGVHTGPVVVGAIGDGLRADYTAAGETTRIAIHLANVAETGQIIISDRMERSAEGLVELAELGEIHVEGQEGPIWALIVQGELSEPVDGLWGSVTLGADAALCA